ncbi:hypothetical protein ABIE78_002505 [Sinorhizobium fredii]|uniref:Uncharacterized protein n=1 Tax=Sinorhizobium fredii (strain USDA 257) TaxID=1185652 RepID=I3X6Y9_SINF2|nr:hypothetical protein [Sinorhizobium fredii]AFL51645.1 hypothetical protein USDA257_c30770 [Sinorhizobium fredii USDA 257]
MKIRFVKDYPGHAVGDVVDAADLSGGLAQGLTNLGIAEKMPEKAVKKGEKVGAAE